MRISLTTCSNASTAASAARADRILGRRDAPRSAGVRLLPAPALSAPWIALHGLDDPECPAAEAREFTSAVSGARFIGVPGITHSYHHVSRWWPAFEAAWRELSAPASAARAP